MVDRVYRYVLIDIHNKKYMEMEVLLINHVTTGDNLHVRLAFAA